MSTLDGYHNLDAENALTAATLTADANGATIDLSDAHGVTFVASVGASGDTLSSSVKIELELEHSDDGSTWTDCADADMIGSVTGTNTGTWAVIDDPAEDATVYRASYVGGKRYVRAVANLTGTHTNGTPVGIAAVKHGVRKGALA